MTVRTRPVRVWSCPVHPFDIMSSYDDDRDPWEGPGECCADCATGHWRTVRDEQGEPLMREILAIESLLLDRAEEMFASKMPLLSGLPMTDTTTASADRVPLIAWKA